MADNITVDNGTLTDYVVATDDDGVAQHQYFKLEWGPDGTFTKVGTGANAVPIQDGGNSITVDGAVTAISAGGVAEDLAISGNPVRVGGRASTARPTAMSADGDIVSPWYDRAGALHVVPGAATTATLSNVNDAAVTTSLLVSNTSRKGVIVVNDSTQRLYLKYGATASLTSYTTYLEPMERWEMPDPIYQGAIDGIWAADASGAARITELS